VARRMIETDTRLDGASLDITAEKRRELLELFPETRGEGETIDFERLRRSLGDAVVEPGKERYGLTWPGKADCYKTIQTPSMATLRPAPEKSVNFDSTENLIIEGDNLEVLKLLQKSYLGKIKMIYIDPPYNTGNDFIYPDDYSESLRTYLQYTGQADADGRKFGTNSDMSGRFHSKWLNMMYPRLYLARNLLSEAGVIYASVGDEEVATLRLIMNDIFGEENFLGILTRVSKLTSNKGTHFSPSCDFILAYASSATALPEMNDPSAQTEAEYVSLFRFSDARGKYNEVSLYMPSLDFRPNQRYLAQCPDGSKAIPPPGKVYRWTRETLARNISENRVVFKQTNTSPLQDEHGARSRWNIYTKIYLHERLEKGLRPTSLLDNKSFTNSSASKELIRLGIEFPFSKPFELMGHLAAISDVGSGDFVLDLFAGSGSTAQSVLELNRRDAGSRRFILVQLPEPTGRPEHPTVVDIAEERVRRVIAKLNENDGGKLDLDAASKQDLGFRVFNLAESNVKEWDTSVRRDVEALEEQLRLNVDHLRHDRSELDILFEIVLKSGFPLSVKVGEESIEGKRVYSIADGAFLICLERNLTLELLRTIAARDPQRVTFLDEGFAGNDQLKTNAVQTFKDKDIVLRTL